MKERRPWFPFHVIDWQSSHSVRLMPLEARGLYIELLAEEWREAGPISSDPEHWQRLLGHLCSDWEASWSAVVACFQVSGETMLSPRLEAERATAADISETRRKAANARWGKREQCKSIPSAELCNATDKDKDKDKDKDREKREARKRAKALYERPPFDLYGLDDPRIQDAWSRWIQCAKRRSSGPYTETGLKRILTRLGDLGPAKALACIEYSETGGYPGLYFDRDFNAGGSRQNGRIPTGMDAVAAYMARKQQHGDDSRGPRLLG